MTDKSDDILLQALSPAEIAMIVDQLEELDPDNELLPAGSYIFYQNLFIKKFKAYTSIRYRKFLI